MTLYSVVVAYTIITVCQTLMCLRRKKGGNQSASMWCILLAFCVSPALQNQQYTDTTQVLRASLEKEANADESISSIREPSRDLPLKRTCRRCQQQITGRSILLIPLTQRTSTERTRESGSSAERIGIETQLETEHRDSAMHESLGEPDGRSERWRMKIREARRSLL